MRFVQKLNQAGEYELWEVEDAPKGQARLQIMGKRHRREAYWSPVDGSIISTERQEREHNKRNNVIQHFELGPDNGREFFQRKIKEREARVTGTSPELRKEIRKDIDVTIEKLKQGMPPAKPREGELV